MCFTGSAATGRRIARASAEHGARAVLELGGKDPAIVDAGVDPGWAAEQVATGAFAHGEGERCLRLRPGGSAHPRRGSGNALGIGPERLHEVTQVKCVHREPRPDRGRKERRGPRALGAPHARCYIPRPS